MCGRRNPIILSMIRCPLGTAIKAYSWLVNIELSCQELYAIWHHMGYSGQDYSAAQAIDHSILKYPMVLALQTADMMASKLLEGDDSNRFESTATSVE